MPRYVQAIEQLARERNALQTALCSAFAERRDSPKRFKDWERAAERFRTQSSELDPFIEACYLGSRQDVWPDLREFMFDYVLSDPQFFRSGYIMERILRRIKSLTLSADEKSIIRQLLLNRVRTKALRNFRYICRLIPMIADAGLRSDIEELVASKDASISHRARFALGYFPGLR